MFWLNQVVRVYPYEDPPNADANCRKSPKPMSPLPSRSNLLSYPSSPGLDPKAAARQLDSDRLIASLANSEIQPDELQMVCSIGHGSSGNVSQVLHMPTSSVLALKSIPVDADEASRKAILLELKALHDCTHAAIVSFYGAFFRAMKATTHSLPATAVYSALEKGVVDAAAWATVGVQGLKWDKFLRHAVEPEFFQTDIGWIMNLDKWKSLDSKSRNLLQIAVIGQEAVGRATLEGMANAERKKLIAEGMKMYSAPNPDAYFKLAVGSAYQRMTDRLKKTKRGPGIVGQLRATWQK